MSDINSLIRKNIRMLTPYSSAKDEFDSSEENILLDANENSIGSVSDYTANRYPDHLQKKLKKILSDTKNIDPGKIFLGNGSDEAIDLLIRAFCEPRREKIMILPPTYGMYEVCAAVNDVGVVEAPLTGFFDIDLSEIARKTDPSVKLIFICSPNNPSANCFDPDMMASLLKEFQGIVIIDEAYIDFAPDKSWLSNLDEYDNLVVLQTFSKAWGMANIRLGMAFASEEIIDVLNKIKYPYNINGPAQEIAIQALNQPDRQEEMVNGILKQRGKLAMELDKLPVVGKIYPSEANFLLVKVTSASKVYKHLLKDKIIVRDRSKMHLCEECIRITVGTAEQNKRLIESLKGLVD